MRLKHHILGDFFFLFNECLYPIPNNSISKIRVVWRNGHLVS